MESITHVTNVANVFYRRMTYMAIRIFTQVSTSARNVANVSKTEISWQYTGVFIQERNRLNVLFVANDSQHQVDSLYTAEFTVERNHTNVTCVTSRLDIIVV